MAGRGGWVATAEARGMAAWVRGEGEAARSRLHSQTYTAGTPGNRGHSAISPAAQRHCKHNWRGGCSANSAYSRPPVVACAPHLGGASCPR